jgi:hypothetical protein
MIEVWTSVNDPFPDGIWSLSRLNSTRVSATYLQALPLNVQNFKVPRVQALDQSVKHISRTSPHEIRHGLMASEAQLTTLQCLVEILNGRLWKK